MDGYVERLEVCGMDAPSAERMCRDILRNFPIYELEITVKGKEIEFVRNNHVETLQPKPNR